MNLIFLITGIFSGIAVCMGTFYSVAQVILHQGRIRWIHFASLVMMLVVMWFLLERDVALARLASPLLVIALLAALWVERRWFKILPLLQLVFAGLLMAGYVRF